MDVDWCLSCGRHVNGSATYCSRECLSHDDPSALLSVPRLDVSEPPSEEENEDDQIIHQHQHHHHEPNSVSHAQWVGTGAAGVMAWAAGIPSGAAGAPSPNNSFFSQLHPTTASPSPSPSPPSTTSPPVFRPPKLLLPHKRPIPPTLCMSTPATARPQPSCPIVTPIHMTTLPLSQPQDVGSTSRTSLQSGITESFIATPSSATAAELPPYPHKSSMFNAFATLRSWVIPGNLPPPAQPAPKRPFYSAKTTALRGKPVTFTVFTKTHHSPTLHVLSSSPSSPSSLPKKTSANRGEFPSLWVSGTAWSPSGGEKESGNLVTPAHARHHPAYTFRGRKASRAIA